MQDLDLHSSPSLQCLTGFIVVGVGCGGLIVFDGVNEVELVFVGVNENDWVFDDWVFDRLFVCWVIDKLLVWVFDGVNEYDVFVGVNVNDWVFDDWVFDRLFV